MAEYDGSIRIGTGIDTKAFKAGSKEIESEARRMAKTVSSSLGDSAKIALQKQTDAFVKMNQQYASQEQKVKDLGSKLHDMQRQKVETDEFKELSKDLDKAKSSLDRLYQRRDSYEQLGKKTPPKLELDISDAERKIKILEADIKELIYTNRAYLPVDTSKVEQEIAAAEQKQMQMYTALQTSADALTSKIAQSVEKESERSVKLAEEVAEEERLAAIRENAVVGNQRIVETVERIKQLEQEIADLKAAGITEGYKDYHSRIQELDQLKQEVRDYSNSTDKMKESYKGLGGLMKWTFSTMAKGFKDIPIAVVKAGVKGLISLFRVLGNIVMKTIVLPFKLFGTVGKKALSSIIPLLKRAASSMFSFGKSTKNSNNALKTGFKNILKYGLGIRSLYALINKLRTAIKEGFTNMANEVEGFKAKVESLKGSTLTLKNSFAAAFRPLVETAIPYIQMVVDAMSQMLDTVGQFMAAISGQKTYTKAIKQTTAAIEDENKAQNKQLSGLDKLNNLSSGSGGDSGSGASSQMFEENVPISSPMLDMFQHLKELVENEDWEGIGAYIAEALNSGMQKIYDVVSWENAAPHITPFIEAFTGAFNGLVDGIDWDLLGRTIGAGINTAINAAYLFIAGIDWEKIGAKLAEGMNGLLDEIDFEVLGKLIAEKILMLPKIIIGFIIGTEWGEVGAAVAETINSLVKTLLDYITQINWVEIGQKFAEGFNKLVEEIDFYEVGRLIGEALMILPRVLLGVVSDLKWEEVGTAIADALNGVVSSIDLSQIGELLGKTLTGIFQAAIDFSSTFDWKALGTNIYQGINSFFENTDWAVVGQGISGFVLGLLDSLITAIEGTDWGLIGESIVELISNIDWIGLAGRLAVVLVDLFISAFDLMWSLRENLIGSLADFFESIGLDGIAGFFRGIQESMANTGEWIRENIFDPVIGWIKELFGIHSPSTVMAEIGSFLMEGLFNGISGLVDKVLSVFGDIKEKISGKWNEIKESTSEAWENIKSGLSEKWENIKTDASDMFENVRGRIADKWNSVKEATGSTWSDIKGRLATDWAAVRDSAGDHFEEIRRKIAEKWDSVKESTSDAWGNVKRETERIWNEIADVIKRPINAILGAVESLANGIIDGINGGINALNTISFSVPDWVPGLGGKSFGFDISTLPNVSIPRLATGAVIPANKEFLAVLGDQKHGTNIEAPLDTIKQALREEFAALGIAGAGNSGGDGKIVLNITANVDGRTLFETTREYALDYFRRTGRNPYPI